MCDKLKVNETSSDRCDIVMSHNTGECKVNSPIECECIEIDFDQYNQFSQLSKKGVTKIKGEKNG